MHDPMVVAFQIKLPIPRREKYREGVGSKRWTLGRRTFTNAEHLGKPVYPWWRPKGYAPVVAGRCYGWRYFITVWHVEPGGRDSGTVCRHYERWQDDRDQWHSKRKRGWLFHVHHWHVQVSPLQAWRARLFDRCALCGRKGRPNLSHQWDTPGIGWRKWRSRQGLYHHECSSLVSLRQAAVEHDLIHRRALAALAVTWDIDVEDVPQRLFKGSDGYVHGRGPGDFNLRYRLDKLIEKQKADA